MPTRRTVLSGVVTFAIGGSLVGVGAASSGGPPSSETQSDRDRTELTVAGDPDIFQVTGVPGKAVPHLEAARRRYRSVSLSDVDRIDGTVIIRGDRGHRGSGTAWGSFDVRSIADELESKPEFSRFEPGDQSEAGGTDRSSQRDTPSETTKEDGSSQSEEPTRRFIRSEPTTAVAVESSRIDIARGHTREDTTERLAGRHARSDPARSGDGDGNGHASVHLSLGGSVRRQLVARLPDSTDKIKAVVRGLKTAGVAIQVAPETSTVRYAISLMDGHHAGDALTDLKADLTAHDGVDLLDQHVSERTLVADVSILTDSIWTVHGDMLSAD